MRKLTFIAISIILSLQITKAQNAEQLFKTEFPELSNVDYNSTSELNKSEIEKFREQYKKLKETSKQLETFKFGGGTDENMTIFAYKELKNVDKAQELSKLQSMVKTNLKSIKKYLSDKTQYGADSIECIEQSSVLKSLTDGKDYKSAYKPWKLLFNCYPISSKNVYMFGEKIITYNIKNTQKEAKAIQKEVKTIIKNAEPYNGKNVTKYNEEITKANAKQEELKAKITELDSWVDTLVILYDQRIKYKMYGKKKKQYGEGYFIGKKGIALYKYQKRTRLKEAYDFLKQSAEMQAKYPSLSALQYYFFAADDLYKKKELEAEKVVEDYTLCQDIIAAHVSKLTEKAKNPKFKAKATKAIESAKKISDNITDKFTVGEYAKCNILVPAFSAKFEKNKDDVKWLKKTISILVSRKGEGASECIKSEFFENATTQLYKLEPSALAAKNLAEFYLKKDQPDYENAAKYYEEAYKLETDNKLKADYYYSAAVVASVQNQLTKSRNLLQSAIELDPNMGKAYILMGKLYVKGLGSCGEDDFEKSMVYWVAADMMNKAKSVDPSVANEANSLIQVYSNKFPRKEEAFMRSITPGKSVTVGCWIQRSTTARFIK